MSDIAQDDSTFFTQCHQLEIFNKIRSQHVKNPERLFSCKYVRSLSLLAAPAQMYVKALNIGSVAAAERRPRRALIGDGAGLLLFILLMTRLMVVNLISWQVTRHNFPFARRAPAHDPRTTAGGVGRLPSNESAKMALEYWLLVAASQ
ncbi:hypothetical protein EVAR_90955_1 [Eumeta japonica]|uniref:Uncharacterized protein n=1 Tax=Eumeta variegata TaxID=151549 RepID=A0A4C1ZCR6_EUMVA|nr:hypothetical protein EVAR_90955_1 [Eumeta japonica]